MDMSKTKTKSTKSPVKSRAKVVTKGKTSENKTKTEGDRYIVKAPFKCKDTGVMYKAGKDVSNFNEGRLKDLLNRGLVELKNA